MTDDEDLTELVAMMLCAKTGDLRELALLAGADPRTFYIGTLMDGVDIRGQDLRGMSLPGLDPSRARIDAHTQFDQVGDALDAPDRPGPTLVYFATETLWQAAKVFLDQWPTVQAYSPRRHLEFQRHCDDSDTSTKLVVADGSSLGPGRISKVDRHDVITLVYRPWRLAELGRDGPTLTTAGSLVLLAPDHKFMRKARGAPPDGLPAIIRDSVAFFAQSHEAQTWLEERRTASFYRTSATAGRRPSSAWFEMASLLANVGASATGAIALCSEDVWNSASRDLPVAKDCSAIELPGADQSRSFALGLLTGFETLEWSEVERQYEETVEAMTLGQVPLMKGQLAGRSSMDFSAPLFLGLQRGWWKANARIAEGSDQELYKIDLPAQGCIIASEPADLPQVLTRLRSERRLTASIRDIAFAMELPTASSWNVVGAQALRFAQNVESLDRQLYFAMLAPQALRASSDAKLRRQLDLLIAQDWELAVRRRRGNTPARASFALTFKAPSEGAGPPHRLPLVLTIDSRGCQLARKVSVAL